MFELVSNYTPSGDQPKAINELVEGIKSGKKDQVLLGATGTGKTFTIANVIKEVNKPTLVLAHNKTLAGQLYSELKELFPNHPGIQQLDRKGTLYLIMIIINQKHMYQVRILI